MHNAVPTPEAARNQAALLLRTLGVSRIVVVDDEYAPDVEKLLGHCAVLDAERAAALPHLTQIDFRADAEIWKAAVRDAWETLTRQQRLDLLAQARAADVVPLLAGAGALPNAQEPVDTAAAQSLEQILTPIDDCEYVTLSLRDWRARAPEFLADQKAESTILLFDRDFHREDGGTQNDGPTLLRQVQLANVGYCGLISHTVPPGGEHDAWNALVAEYNLIPDRFVVIAKERLTTDSPDYYGFLGMLRLVALSKRYASVKSTAWTIFETSVAEASASLERLSILDFDRIIFESSRREGVWEPDTLFRVFGILMRCEARARLRENEDMSAALSAARPVSAMPQEVATALRNETASREALRIQRFETYDSAEQLNRYHVPIDLGDIFEHEANGHRYILLAQPCDLMVRSNGKRSYDAKYRRTGTLVELVITQRAKDGWGELPYYNEETGEAAFANFAKAHQAQLSIVDLCATQGDGVARIDVDTAGPELLIASWKERYEGLRKYFRAAIQRYEELRARQVSDELKLLALPQLSATAVPKAMVNNSTLEYEFKRVLRLRQPWSGALLTAFTQYQARAAFEHPFDYRVATAREAAGDQEPDHVEAPGATAAPAESTE